MNYDSLPTHTPNPLGSGNGTPQSHHRSQTPTRQSRLQAEATAESRTNDEIFKARWRCRSLIESTDDLSDLPWQRITDDPVYRVDFIAALYDLYTTHRISRGKLSPIAASFGNGLDGSEGNSGQPRGSLPEQFAPRPTLNGYPSELI